MNQTIVKSMRRSFKSAIEDGVPIKWTLFGVKDGHPVVMSFIDMTEDSERELLLITAAAVPSVFGCEELILAIDSFQKKLSIEEYGSGEWVEPRNDPAAVDALVLISVRADDMEVESHPYHRKDDGTVVWSDQIDSENVISLWIGDVLRRTLTNGIELPNEAVENPVSFAAATGKMVHELTGIRTYVDETWCRGQGYDVSAL